MSTSSMPGRAHSSGLRNKRERLSSILAFLRPIKNINSKLNYLEQQTHGSRATFVGNNRVLVKVVIKGRNIAYFVEADDLLVSPWFIITGTYETPLTDYFLRELQPDSHCLDVGSNFGYFVCLMARFCPQGRIIAVEPDENVYPLARDNIAINGFAHATVIHAAASDTECELTLYRRSERSANTSIVPVEEAFTTALGELPVVPFKIPGVPVDILADRLDGRVDFMKVDVEGAEPLVISGAQRTISRNPQMSIVMEWSPGQMQAAGFNIGSFIDDLRLTGLKAFDLDRDAVRALSYDELLNLPYRAGVVLKRS